MKNIALKKFFKSFSALILALTMIFCSSSVSLLKSNAADETVLISDFKNGDVITLGSYPQSKVTNKETLEALNKLTLKWVSYNYYSGSGELGSMKSSSYMKYADVTYNSKKYRAVKFTKYRPTWGTDQCSESNSVQATNGYYVNKVYWFSYDAIEWKVLDSKTGLILCQTLIDSQPFANTIYEFEDNFFSDSEHQNFVNNYEESSIRQWLNNNFYNTAFTKTEKEKIASSKIDNSSITDNFSAESTTDKIFLLSRSEILNKNYGFNSTASKADSLKQAKGSDYAKCQGLNAVQNSEYSNWLLRTAADSSRLLSQVTDKGVTDTKCNADRTNKGIRPALKVNLKSDMSSSVISPAQVTGLKVSDKTSKTAVLNWSKASGAQKYYIMWYNASTKKYKKLGETTKTTCSLSSLKSETSYKFIVKAVKTVGSKEFSGKASAALSFTTLKATAKPAQVTGLTLTEKSSTSASLSWNKIGDADKYIVMWYSASEKKYKELGRAPKESCTLNSLKEGTKYSIIVKALKIVDGKEYIGKESAVLSFTTVSKANADKMKVTELNALLQGTNELTLTWQKVASAQGYSVYQYKSEKWEKVADVTSDKWKATKLKAGTTYKFKVAAYKKSGSVLVYAAQSSVVTTSTKPAAPTVTLKAEGNGKVTVTCSKVTGATGYFLYYCETKDGKYTRYNVTKNSTDTTTLTKGKTYYFKAKAYKSLNDTNYISDYSKTVKVTVK